MTIRPWVVGVVTWVGGVALVGVPAAWAQGRGQGQRKMAPEQDMRLPTLNVDGVVEAVGPGALRVKSDAGHVWLLQVPPNTKFLMTGTAKVECLAPGGLLSCISFVAEVDTRRAKVDAKVARLSLFTPSTKREIGAVPSQGFGAKLGEGAAKPDGAKTAPAAKPAKEPKLDDGAAKPPRGDFPFGDGGLGEFGPSKAAVSRKGGRGGAIDRSGPAVRSLEVSGQITSIKNGKVTLHAPNMYFRSPLRFELAEDPQIDVELIHIDAIGLVRAGDRVKALCGQMSENMARANDITVVLAAPLGGGAAKRKPPARSARKADTDADPSAEKSEKTESGEGAKSSDKTPSSEKAAADKSESTDDAPPTKPARKSKTRPKPANENSDDTAAPPKE